MRKLAPAALRVSVFYAIASALYILLSDRLVAAIATDARTWSRISIFKGWAFVAVTACLLYVAIRAQLRHVERESEERLRVDSERRAVDERLRRATQAANVGLWDWDLRSSRVYYSPEWKRQIGYREDEISDEFAEWETRVHPDDLARMRKAIEEHLEGRADFQQEFRFRHKDGSYRWILAQASVERDSEGAPIRMLGSHVDVTDRRLAIEENARLAIAVHEAVEDILITDTEGTILYVNPAFERVSGYSRDEAVGLNPRFLKSGRHDDEFYRELWETLSKGEVWRGTLINRRKDGALYEEEATISPVHDASGAVVNYVAVRRDVTYEQSVKEQLRQSQKLEAIGLLAGGVAHDFNNMLAVVQGHVELIETDGDLPAKLQGSINEIRKAAERGARLTQQLLLFGRRQTLQLRDCDLNEVVGHTTGMLQRILGEDIDLEFHLATTPLRVRADPGMIDQVLLNLAVNARDAMPNGGRLSIRTEETRLDEHEAATVSGGRPGIFACMLVTDTGNGIADDVLPRIFEPFFTTKETGKGTGLGLATVLGIVQQHGGWIRADSAPGNGASFRIGFPRRPGAPKTASPVPVRPEVRGGGETILLVEDDVPVREMVRTVLSRLGYRVLEARTGRDALAVWREHRDEIRLLLTDLVMPDGLSGLDLASALQESEPRLQVIYTSGYSPEIAGRDVAMREGVNFLSKPFSPGDLARTIRERLGD